MAQIWQNAYHRHIEKDNVFSGFPEQGGYMVL